MGFRHKLIAILIPLALSACSAEHDGFSNNSSNNFIANPNPDPALALAAANILGPKCASCHGVTGSNPEFLNTAENPDLDSLKDKISYVRIGQGELSALFIRSNDGSMPPGNPLTENEADTIKAWIDDLGIAVETIEDDETPLISATFSEIETNILAPKCYGCHANQNPQFENYQDVRDFIVAPFNLGSSLYTSITAGASGTGNVMPKNSAPLLQTEIDAIESWILDGALNN